MKKVGIFLVVAGIVWALIAFSMDTSVSTSYGSVNNVGLMAARTNNLMFAGLTILVGVVLIGFGSSPKQGAQSIGLRACPFCAEQIQPAALKCRYCNSELPDSFRTASPASSLNITVKPTDQHLRALALCSELKQKPLNLTSYMVLAKETGGHIEGRGVFVESYVYINNGKVTKIGTIDDLRPWFIINIVSLIERSA